MNRQDVETAIFAVGVTLLSGAILALAVSLLVMVVAAALGAVPACSGPAASVVVVIR